MCLHDTCIQVYVFNACIYSYRIATENSMMIRRQTETELNTIYGSSVSVSMIFYGLVHGNYQYHRYVSTINLHTTHIRFPKPVKHTS